MTDIKGPGIPSEERRRRGRVACIECFQRIPCDPCRTSCPRGAISFDGDITSLPRLDEDLCSGCGICVAKCPGLAAFVVDQSKGGIDRVSFPWEYLPLPREGSEVSCTDRAGRTVTRGRVVSVLSSPAFDRTCVVTVEVPEGFAMEVRGIDRKELRKGGTGDV